MNRKQKKVLIRIILAFVLLVTASVVTVDVRIRLAVFLIPYIIIGYDILINAVKGVINRQPFDENFLMAVATVGAMALGEYSEGVAVMLFYQTGELFQSYAIGKSRRNIAELMDISPDYANVEQNGELVQLDPCEVAVGSVIVVKPGERVPIDGEVTEGETTLDTAALTGESAPRSVKAGEAIISGCINLTGLIKVKTTREFGESTVSKILELVENASSRKSRSEKFISRFARLYTPVVCFLALALCIVPPIFRAAVLGTSAEFGVWLYRALTFLVISCPCALVISIPLGFFAGIGGASNAGVLIKGSNYLETLADVKCVAFDKTGTLTKGTFAVSDVQSVAIEEKKLLEVAALAESFSTHPISRSIRQAVAENLDLSRVSDVREVSGKGVCATVDGNFTAVGNARLMEDMGISVAEDAGAATPVYVAINNEYAGCILISDEIKENAKDAICALRTAGVKSTVMLSGDVATVAEAVAARLGIDDVYAALLPADKVQMCEKLLGELRGKEKLAYV
ncbi:MAG: cadmium-translocating P-type ATPase, partial [Oscillospiraceae bacterium]|nr:cadmium-translocating P-type ATPase [Oscillospiraceae bacterium]